MKYLMVGFTTLGFAHVWCQNNFEESSQKDMSQNTRDKLDTFSAKFCIFLAQSDWRKNKK
jgi:hypothetical protein